MNKLYRFVNSLKYTAVWEINGADFISLIPVDKLAIERNCETDFVTNSKRRLTEKIGLRHNFHRSEGNTQKNTSTRRKSRSFSPMSVYKLATTNQISTRTKLFRYSI